MSNWITSPTIRGKNLTFLKPMSTRINKPPPPPAPEGPEGLINPVLTLHFLKLTAKTLDNWRHKRDDPFASFLGGARQNFQGAKWLLILGRL